MDESRPDDTEVADRDALSLRTQARHNDVAIPKKKMLATQTY